MERLRAPKLIGHRTCFFERVESCATSGRGCALLEADLDRFMMFNDQFGFQKGDRWDHDFRLVERALGSD